MKQVYLYGAIDRFNYGDLLLPVLLKEKLNKATSENPIEIRVFGTIQSNLSNFGALPTESLKDFYIALKANPAFVLVVGGEVLTPNWSTVYSHLPMPQNSWHASTRALRKINIQISKFLLGGYGRRPFILNPRYFPYLKGVLYNGVGGKRHGKYKRSDFKNLKNAHYLSCRDKSVLSVLHKNLPSAELVPDSAIQMSELYTTERLNHLVSEDIRLLLHEDYIFFQVSLNVANEIGMESLSEKLHFTAKTYHKKVVLCPIGTASGHDDQLALQQLKELLTDDEFILVEGPSLWDIMGLIASASLYIGGSLHGIITSMSFEVPYLFLRDRPKLVAYVDTWGVEELKGSTTLANWEQRVETALQLKVEKLKKSRDKQLQISEKSFQEMVQIIING
ncbi:MAG TPA: polysaccharide pyruvyl transferase family protein [Bacteroidales bacterium]|nr:polysaccharide pyruvyl transferase family protein [Bacteroidales bacterium]